MSVILVIQVVDEIDIKVVIEERFTVETLAVVMMNFDGEDIND